jgi:uncharacterized protein
VITEADVARAVATVVALCNPDHVYVFGSYAKGLVHAESDLDLLVVKDSRLPRVRRGKNLDGILATLALSVDVLFFTPEEVRLELADPYSMLSAIMPSAKLLYPPS